MNKIIVENDTMRFYSTPVPVPVGGSQWSKIFFMFSDEWEDLRKIAQFRQGELKRNVDIDSSNFCYVPNEMLPDMCGELSIVGYPQDTSSAVIATANSLMLSFVQGFESGGEPAVPPTPDLYQKLLKEFAESGGGNPDAVLYTKQELTYEQQKQARTNIGAGQPVFAVNVTATLDDTYTADKTAAEIEAAYQAGRTIVCRWAVPFIVSGIPVELPLKSRVHDRDFLFNVNQLVKKQIFTITVEISDSGVKPSVVSANIYEKPADGIPKSDLASDVQTSLDNAMQQDGGTYSNYIKAATTSGVLLLQNEMRVGGLGTGNCVNIDKTQIKIFGKSGTLGLYADASRIHNLETPSVDTDAANKQYVDAAKTEAQQLGLTAATPGQIIKVKTVQDGKPTEWEAVDMPDVGSYTLPTASADTLGGVKVGDGLSIADGVLSASRSANGFEKISTIELTETGLPVYILVPADKSEIYINANQMYVETSGTINFNIGPQADGYSRSTILSFTCGTHNYGMSALVYLRALGEYNNYFNYVGQGVVSSGFSDTVAISSQGLSRMKSWQSSFGRGYIGIIGAITMLGGTVEIWAK